MQLTVHVDSLEVLHSRGGVRSLSGPEKTVARSNPLKSLQAGQFPQIRFHADDLQRSGDGSRVTGSLETHGRTRAHVVDLHTEDVGDRWRLSCDAVVLQSDFGIKLYSMLLGRDEGRRRGDGVRHRAPAKRT